MSVCCSLFLDSSNSLVAVNSELRALIHCGLDSSNNLSRFLSEGRTANEKHRSGAKIYSKIKIKYPNRKLMVK